MLKPFGSTPKIALGDARKKGHIVQVGSRAGLAQLARLHVSAQPNTFMKIEKITSGNGAAPKPGDTVTVHYTGWLTDGTKFDSSVDRDDPFAFVLGEGQVIQGWDQGIATLRVGDKARFTIPPELGYGESGYPDVIPPNATLIFEVELLSIA
jgi:FKBP-type peptidyl-prolyl cis-trans isomerase FkpA